MLECAGTRVLICAASGVKLSSGRDANDLISSAREHDAAVVALPLARFGDDFLELRTRVAGEFVQKLVTYRVHVAIVGDITVQISGRRAPRDFVSEANRGRHIGFVTDLRELEDRLRRSIDVR